MVARNSHLRYKKKDIFRDVTSDINNIANLVDVYVILRY